MSEPSDPPASRLRQDLVTGRHVLVVPGRAARPHTVVPGPPGPSAVGDCPFCPGNEADTPPERCRTGPGAPDAPGWRIRVVPNLYPIVAEPGSGPGPHGAHEVVILGPDHSCDLGRLDDAQVEELFSVLRDRARAHRDAGLAHSQVLVNHGRAAGASIAHPHAQVLAIDFVPPLARDLVARFATYGDDLVAVDHDDAARHGSRVVEADHVWAWCPSAAASPYETRISASDAGPRLEDAPDAALAAIARVTRDVVAGIADILGDVAYNVVVYNAPARDHVRFHWFVEVVPRVATVAGFEMGTGLLVNTMAPADAARRLRDGLAGRT